MSTRFLQKESRCQCTRPKLVQEDDTNASVASPGEPGREAQTLELQKQFDTGSTALQDVPAWQTAVLANLPDQYEVLAMVGEGGMGTVWKVRDKGADKIYAIKVLRSWLIEDNNALNRFEQEAEAARDLSHANLVAVHSFGMGSRGAPYLVMDYLAGRSLAKIIKEAGCIGVPRAIDLFIQIAEAVQHAHSKGVLHRDIKPSNIIVEINQEGLEIVKLIDLGIAKVLPKQTGLLKGQARAGEVFGSPPYMSPEQCLGDTLDDRSDLYALGCVMYEALSGKPPFGADSPIKTMSQHVEEEPQAIRKASKEQIIPHDLEYVIMHCLEKSPQDRYQSMQDLADDLRKIKENKPIARVLKLPPAPGLEPNIPAGATAADSGAHKPSASTLPLPSDSGPYKPLTADSGPYKPLAPESTSLTDSGPHKWLAQDSFLPAESGPHKRLVMDPSQSLDFDPYKTNAPDSAPSVDPNSLRALDAYRSLETTDEAIDPDLYRLYKAQSQSLKTICGVLVVLLVAVASVYAINSFHQDGSSTQAPTVSARTLPEALQIDGDLVAAVEKGAQRFMQAQQYDNAAPLLEAAIRSQEHLGTKSVSLARDQEGLARCYAMLSQLDRSAHWYEQALRTYEEFLSKSSSGFNLNRNSDWASASSCAKDYADVLTKLNRNSEAQALEKKWSSR